MIIGAIALSAVGTFTKLLYLSFISKQFGFSALRMVLEDAQRLGGPFVDLAQIWLP